LTAVAGVIDAVSYLGLGHVFAANMTGNVVFLGFGAAGAQGLSVERSGAALLAFLLGAVAGGRMAVRADPARRSAWLGRAFGVEGVLLGAATLVSVGEGATLTGDPMRLYGAIVLISFAMGLRNATIRKVGVPDLTTTVLTLTITGLAADSTWAGGRNPRLGTRAGAVGAMFAGGALGVLLVRRSVAWALAVSALGSLGCALRAFLRVRREALRP
jgi:uncharacterized membrane protein YoaK (UPF0700 family)